MEDPATFGPYVKGKKLFSGTNSNVWECEKADRVIKHTFGHLSEVIILTFLSIRPHPNIITYFDHFIPLPGRVCVVLERCEANLYQVIHDLTIKDVKKVVRQTAAGLSHIHAYGIVHLDIKPENLLIKEGNIKIADFGASCTLSGKEKETGAETHGIYTTWPYCAPEIFFAPYSASLRFGCAADLWSLGVTLYELVYGEMYFAPGPSYCGAILRFSRLVPRYATFLPQSLQVSAAGIIVEIPDTDQLGDMQPLFHDLISPEPRDRPSAKKVADDPILS